jgi:hypothetical protein
LNSGCSLFQFLGSAMKTAILKKCQSKRTPRFPIQAVDLSCLEGALCQDHLD